MKEKRNAVRVNERRQDWEKWKQYGKKKVEGWQQERRKREMKRGKGERLRMKKKINVRKKK